MAKNSKKNGIGLTPTLPAPINPLNVLSTYANNMEISATVMDVRIAFNEVIVGPATSITVERRANIVMSHSHFDSLMTVLRNFQDSMKKQDAEALKAQA